MRPTRYQFLRNPLCVGTTRIELILLRYQRSVLPLDYVPIKMPPSLRALLFIILSMNYMGMPFRKVAPVRSIFTIFVFCVCNFYNLDYKDKHYFLICKFFDAYFRFELKIQQSKCCVLPLH